MSPSKSPEILIIGGTGTVGSELLSLLMDARVSFRILLRVNSTSKLINTEYMDVVRGDLDDTAFLKTTLQGIKKIFLLTRDQIRQSEMECALIELAVQANVETIIKSSAFAADLNPPVGYGISHAISEKKLMTSGVNWVILRPYVFMELSEVIMTRGLMPLPMGKAEIGLIDARDVALAAKTILLEEGHRNISYNLTGPELLNLTDCSQILSETLGRPIRYFSPPYFLAAFMMRKQGVSKWDIAMRKKLFQMIREGGEARTTDKVEYITGKKPRSLLHFIRDHKEHFLLNS